MLGSSKKTKRPPRPPGPPKRPKSVSAAVFIRRAQRAAKRWWKVGRKIWSLQGAALVSIAAVAFSIIHILVTVHGKLVILPFEVRSDQSTPSDLGASFSASLSVALNDYRSLFPSSKPSSDRKTITSKNYFDLIQVFMSDLPFVEIPKTSLNKGATFLEAIKIGPVSIPVSQLIFENLAFFHDDTLRGSLEVWGNELVAKISLGSDDSTMTVSVPKDQGYRALINRVTVELLQKKKWIDPVPMKLPALILFSEGLRNYLNFDLHAEDRFINSAREKYDAALQADRNADLARLHLAVTQHTSTDPAVIVKAIENFSLLFASQDFKRMAKIGYVASSLRYMERAGGCSGLHRFLAPTLQEVKSWEQNGERPAEIEELLLWSGTFHLTAGYLLPGKPCAQWIEATLPGNSVDELLGKAQKGYQQALSQIAEPKRYSKDVSGRYRLYVLLKSKYLLDDMVDYSLLSKSPNLELANAALKLGLEIQKEKDGLPEAQRRFFAPSLMGSIADSYLRIAKIRESEPQAIPALIAAAIDQLRVAVGSTEPLTAQWALFRLADLELGQSNAGLSLEWLIRAYSDQPSFLGAFDESYFPVGALIEKPAQRCEVAKLLKKGSLAGNVTSKLLLVDVLRRLGDVQGATATADSLQPLIESPTKWVGGTMRQKLSLLKAKLKPETSASPASETLWEQFNSLDRASEFLKLDIFELAAIKRDENLLTRLKAVISFPPLYHSYLVQYCG